MDTVNHNTFGVIFYLRKYKAKNGRAPIYLRITVNGRRAELSTKQSVEMDHWDGYRGRVRGTREEARIINRYLEQVKGKIVEYYRQMTLDEELITAEALKSKFLGTDKGKYSLSMLVEYHNTQMKDTLAWGTLKNYFTTAKYIQRFLKQKKGTTDIYLSDISYKLIIDFEYFLRKWQPTDHQRPLNNNGVMKHMERFRKMTNLALRMEWIKHDPFAKYKLRFEKVEREFLSEQELQAIEEKDFSLSRLEYVRDIFVFSCYTGLAYIDLINLTPDNISIGIDGNPWLITHRQKTSSPVRVPLLPKAEAVIEKYKDNPQALNEGTLLPRISNQKTNSYLKEIADLCDINKNLTFHLARHTFATTVTLSNGVPIESVSKMLGHTKISTTQIYAKVVETKISQDMDALRFKLEQKNARNRQTGTLD